MVFAAAHVVADPLGDNAPGAPAAVDWDATLAFRRHLWSHGLGVAEAMDTAQRSMGLDWAATRELIRRSAAEAARARRPGSPAAPAPTTAAGPADAGRDHRRLRGAARRSSRRRRQVDPDGLAGAGRDRRAAPRTTCRSTASCSAQADRPVILHWLGRDVRPGARPATGARATSTTATDTVPRADRRARRRRCDGVKVSLLDAEHEIGAARRAAGGRPALHRRRLQLPRADRGRRRAALATPCWASSPRSRRPARPRCRRWTRATRRLTGEILAPTVPLSRHLFAAPTYYYKTGIVFLAWLNGHQHGFTMVGGLQAARSLPHLSDGRSAGRPGRAAARPGARRAPDGAPARPCTASSVQPSGGPGSRAARRGCRSTRRRPSSGRCAEAVGGRRRRAGIAADRAVARAGRRGRAGRGRRAGPPTPGCGSPRLCRGGFFTAADREAPGGAGRQPPGDRRGRAQPLGAPDACWSWSPAACPRRPDLAGARQRVADAIAGWSPYARERGRRAGHRAAAPDVRRRPRRDLHARPGAGHRRAVRPREPSASSSTPTTSGGTRELAEQIARAGGRRIAELPGLRLDDPAAGRRAAGPGHDGRRVHRLRRDHRGRGRGRLHAATSRWRSSTRTSGTTTRRRSPAHRRDLRGVGGSAPVAG